MTGGRASCDDGIGRDVLEAVLRRDFHLWQESLGIRRAGRLSEERRLFDEHLTLVTAATITGRTDEGLRRQLQEFGNRGCPSVSNRTG